MTIDSIGIGNITTLATFNRSTAPHAPKRCYKVDNKKVRSGGCFAAHLWFISCARFGMADERRDASEED